MELSLLLLLFSELLARLFELFLLLLGDLHNLRANQHLLLHLLELFHKLLLLGLCLLLGILLGLKLFNQLLLFLSLEVGLVEDLLLLTLSFLPDFFFLSGETILKLSHLLMVSDDFSRLATGDHSVHLHDFLGGLALVESVELLLQLGDLVLVLTQESILGVLVDTRLILDVLSAGRIAKRVHRLVKVVVSWSDIGNHDCFGVATEGVLEQSGQLTVTVWDVGGLGIGEGRDNMAQRRQRQVDLRGFLESIARGSSLGDSLRTRQIDHVKLANADVLLVVRAKLTALNSDREKRV